MKELSFEQTKEVNGGVLPLIGVIIVADSALIGVMVGMQQAIQENQSNQNGSGK